MAAEPRQQAELTWLLSMASGKGSNAMRRLTSRLRFGTLERPAKSGERAYFAANRAFTDAGGQKRKARRKVLWGYYIPLVN